MFRIRRISIGSAFKVGAVYSALLWVIFGTLFVLFPSLLTTSFVTTSTTPGIDSIEFDAGLNIASFAVVFLCCAPAYAVIGGLSAAFTAFIYNLVAGWIGGVEVELERSGGVVNDWTPVIPQQGRTVDLPDRSNKPKNDPLSDDDPFAQR